VPTDQAGVHVQGSPGTLESQLGSTSRRIQDDRTGIRRSVGGRTADDPSPRSRGDSFVVRTVDVDDRHAVGRKQFEQPSFRVGVGLERTVVVEMVAAEVGVDRPVRLDAQQTPLVESMTRGFQDHRITPVPHHATEH
jgi:hypothetical protein